MFDTASLARPAAAPTPLVDAELEKTRRGRSAAAAGPSVAAVAVSARAASGDEAAASGDHPAIVIDCRVPTTADDNAHCSSWLMTQARAATTTPHAAAVALRAWPSSSSSSSALEGNALRQALSRAGSRNSFVCQQLACMWSEQRDKVKERGANREENEEVFLATAALQGDDSGNGDRETATIAAAAIFYARPGDASTPAHVYVELMVSSTPGRGIGALLLRFVEAFAAANAQALGGAKQVRLLGVEAAKAFYARCGYKEDEKSSCCKYRRKEMVKELSVAAAAAV